MDLLITFLQASVIAGTPLLYATLGGIISERSGHLNLGIEGMMLMGAIGGFMAGVYSSNVVVAVVCAALLGSVGAGIYAFLTVTLKTNHVVTGLTLSIFGAGFANFMGSKYIGVVLPGSVKEALVPIKIPVLSNIPIIGNVLFNNDILVYMSFVLAIVFGIYLYNTRPGLHLRTVGENPAAADFAGISVSLYRYVHILIGGALCGIGGAYISLVYVPSWMDNITSGKGWIAVALVIFSTWNPYKAIYGAIFFGALSIVNFRLQNYNIPLSPHLLEMLPYVATALVLIITSMRKSKNNQAPKALGLSYFREER